MRPIKRVALLHDICGIGKAAMTNMLPVLSVMGIEVCPIPTILLSTHTGGFGKPAIEKVSTQYICDCADHYVEQGISFDLIFVGYLGSEGMVDAIIYFLSKFPNTKVIFDPIMGDAGTYYRNFDEEYGKAMRRILPYANIVLPNITEACILASKEYKELLEEKELLEICSEICSRGAQKIIITSVSRAEGKKSIAIYDNNECTLLEKEALPFEFHGTGDVFAAVFTGAFLKGASTIQAANLAHEFVTACMNESEIYDFQKKEGLLIEKMLHLLA